MSEKKAFDKDIELQKIQVLQNDFQAWFNTVGSLWVGGFIGLAIMILTVYYSRQFNPDANWNLVLSLISIAILYAMFGYYAPRFMNKRSNDFLVFVDELFANVEKGDALGSIMELKKKTWRKKKTLVKLKAE